MIIDINAWAGHWNTLAVRGEVSVVRRALRQIGVERICMSPLQAAWSHNPHLCNTEVYRAAHRYEDIDPVPVLDPTIPTWREELERAVDQPRLRLVKLLPAYGGYQLEEAGALFERLARAGLGAVVQTRLEDPRRQHPLAQAEDVPAAAVAQVALQHPGLQVIVGGASWKSILDLGDMLLQLPNFYADISQADGLDGIKVMVQRGLGKKLLFGTHAPLFVPLAGLARIVMDLEGEEAAAILGANARRLLDGKEQERK